MKFIKQLFITIIFLGVSSNCFSQVEKDTLRILFVGNSYTYIHNMPHLASLISDNTEVKLVTTKSTAGGSTLKNHWKGEKGLTTKQIISQGNFDIVVLQEHSMGTIEKQVDFLHYSKKLCNLIKATGAKPFFYVTWARQKVPQYQETITNAYQQASKENDCGLVMVGEAWELARKLRPEMPLFMPDGSHQSNFGAFLTACVFVNTLSGELPKKLPNGYFIRDTKGEKVTLFWENPLDVAFCVKVASKFR